MRLRDKQISAWNVQAEGRSSDTNREDIFDPSLGRIALPEPLAADPLDRAYPTKVAREQITGDKVFNSLVAIRSADSCALQEALQPTAAAHGAASAVFALIELASTADPTIAPTFRRLRLDRNGLAWSGMAGIPIGHLDYSCAWRLSRYAFGRSLSHRVVSNRVDTPWALYHPFCQLARQSRHADAPRVGDGRLAQGRPDSGAVPDQSVLK
jgi:hypothetical protein